MHLREMGEPETDAQGCIVRTFGTLQDITNIRRAEESLRQSESKLRQAQRLARIGTFIWDDVAGLCIDCSDDLAALFGLSPEQFIAERGTGEKFAEFVHEEDRDELRETVRKGLEKVLTYEVEYRAYDATGDIRHFREIVEPITDNAGRQVRTFGTVQDITHLRQAEAALRQSEEQFRSLIEGSIQGVLIHRDFKPVFVNQALADIFGYDSPDEIRELESFVPLIADDERDRLESIKRARAENRKPPEKYDFQGLRKDGSHIWLENRGNLVQWGGETAILSVMVDVTEQHQAEAALRENEQQLRTITDNLPAFIVYVDRDLYYRFANRLAEEWFGRPSSQIVGRHVRDVMDPEALERLYPNFMDVLAGKNVRFEENRAIGGGPDRCLDFSYVPDFGEDGQVRGFFALVLDITDRRQAENALRQTMRSDELLRQTAMAANDATSADEAMAVCLEAICRHGEWDLAGVFVLADDDSGDMAPAGLWWAENPDDFKNFRQVTESIRCAPGTGLPGRVAKSGKPVWIPDVQLDKNFPRARITDRIQVVTGFAFPVQIGQDVAAVLEFYSCELRERDDDLVDVAIQAGSSLARVIERQRAERALRDSEEQIRLMTDNIPVLITYVDHSKTYVLVNKTTEEWYARPALELVGTPIQELMGKKEFAKIEARIDMALAGESVQFEEVLTYPNGVTRHIDATYVPHFGVRGNVRGVFAFVADVTDRIKTEEQLRHAQRMETIGKLTGGIAHDFNNLLAVIMGNSEVVGDKLGEEDPAVSAIRRTALRGSELTQRLLAFSRQQSLRPEAVDLSKLTSEMAGILTRTLGETIAIKVKSPRRPWLAKVDIGELENAVLNLAINARDAMPGGGVLTIETDNVTLSAKKAAQFENAAPGKYIRLSLTDTGSGMPAEILEHAFEPFFTTKAFGDGSGLGLSMVYGFASQSGGFVNIDSSSGKGATVSLYLPRADAGDKPRRDDGPIYEPVGKGGVILVVEDDPDVRRLTVTLLGAMGYIVLEAEDGESALPLILGDRHVDLLLSDVVLPGDMSGPAIAEAALAKRPGLRVMFMSGYAEDVIRRDREGVRKTVDADLLTKPFTRAQLAQKVKSAMGTVKNARS